MSSYEPPPEVDPQELLYADGPAYAGNLDALFSSYSQSHLNALKPDTTNTRFWVDSVLAEMSLDERIGQLFVINLFPRGNASRNSRALSAVRNYDVGGFLVPRNMDPDEVYSEIADLQEESTYPLLFAADYERGVGRYNNNFTEWPSNMALGATRDPLFAAASGRLTAIEARSLGVNMLLAPVVDVNNNPANPIINIRSYGEDPALVGQLAEAFVHEAQEMGVLTTLKHFPGHGNTSVDTHTRMGIISGTKDELKNVELYPYLHMLASPQKPAAVMSAHLWIQALDREPVPATLSRNALFTLLRDTLSFDGLVVTDDVKMGALQQDYSLKERTVHPILAGADMVLTPRDLPSSIRMIKDAIRDGLIKESRLNQSVRRILLAKARAGLHNKRIPDEEILSYLLDRPRGEPLAIAAADKAVTVLKNDRQLPLKTAQHVVLIQMANQQESPSIEAAMDRIATELKEKVKLTDIRIGFDPSDEEIEAVHQDVARADVAVVTMYLRTRAGRGGPSLYPQQRVLVDQLVDRLTPAVLVTLGNPYAVSPYEEAEALVVAYEQSMATVVTLTDILQGKKDPAGRLPITVGNFAYGSGLTQLEYYLASSASENGKESY